MKNNNFIFFLMIILCCTCSGELTKSEKHGQDISPKHMSDYNYPKYYDQECKCGPNAELIIKTKYIEVADSINFDGVVALSQKLIFKQRGRNLKTLFPPFRINKISIIQKDSIDVLSTIIRDVKCVQKGKKFIYQIYGAYCFDPSHEFFALCSLNGEWLWYYYGSMREVYGKHGDEEPYVSQFGKEIHSLKNMIRVFPPNNNKKDRKLGGAQ